MMSKLDVAEMMSRTVLAQKNTFHLARNRDRAVLSKISSRGQNFKLEWVGEETFLEKSTC